MLVLSRYRDESIIIGDDIVVTVVDVRGDRVRLGIQAPSHVSVHRREIYEAIAKERSNEMPEKGTASPRMKSTPPAPTEPADSSFDVDSFGSFRQ